MQGPGSVVPRWHLLLPQLVYAVPYLLNFVPPRALPVSAYFAGPYDVRPHFWLSFRWGSAGLLCGSLVRPEGFAGVMRRSLGSMRVMCRLPQRIPGVC